ncbi:hypothetical protein DWB84_07320 [Saccharophagus sp. K07]|jgi:hypothetical protein|nr:hypothetical protein [Saccharophagus sp. K07]
MQGNELYIFLGLAVVVGLFFFLKGNKRPPAESFTCARCKKAERYSPRTIEAWRRGFSKIYCQACHKLWLNNNPERKKQTYTSGSARGGCLGILVIFVLMPPAIYGVIRYVS